MSRARGVARALGVLWLAAVAVALVMPSRWIPTGVIDSDGLAHAVAFAVAVALWTVALPHRVPWVLAAAVVAAAGSEVAQAVFTPNREAGWSDVGANLSGIVLGLAVGLAVSKSIERWAPGERRRDAGGRTRGPR